MEAEAFEVLGDAAWLRDDHEAALQLYRRCRDHAPRADQERAVSAKMIALLDEPDDLRELMLDYFLREQRSPVSLFYPLELLRQRPASALASYLVGRRLWAVYQWRRAIPFLTTAVDELPAGVLQREAQFMLGQSLYFTDEPSRSSQVFEALLKGADHRHQSLANEWMDRIAWSGGNRVEGK